MKSYFKDLKSLKAVIIELFSKFLPLILIPFITRSFGAEKYTEYVFYESLLFIFATLYILGQDAAISRSTILHREENRISVRNQAFFMTVSFGLISTFISLSLQNYAIALISLGAIVISLSNMLSMVPIALKELKNYNLSRITNQLAAFFLTIIFVILNILVIETRLIFIVIGFCISFIFLYPYLKEFSFQNPFENKLILNYLIGIGIYLLLHSISNIARLRIDKVFFLDLMPELNAANIALASFFIFAIASFIDSIFKIFLPSIYETFKNQNYKNLLRNIFFLLGIGLLIPIFGLICFLLPENLYSIIFGDDFYLVGFYIFIMTLPYFLLPIYLYMVNFAIFIKETKQLGIISLLSSLAWMVFAFGILKIGYAIEFVYISQALIFLPTIMFFLYKRFKITR